MWRSANDIDGRRAVEQKLGTEDNTVNGKGRPGGDGIDTEPCVNGGVTSREATDTLPERRSICIFSRIGRAD